MRLTRTSLALACVVALAGCQAAVRPAPAEAVVVDTPIAVATPELPPLPPPPAEPTPAIPDLPAPAALPAMGHGQEVFDRIRRGLSPGACDTGPNGMRWRKRFAGQPAVFARHLEELLPLLDFVSIEVERSGLPAEFVFIPLVESDYRPGAVSGAGPSGMWQFIGSTARNHGIHIRPGYDGRLSPVESTRAALSYLKTLQGMFGNWQAIVMAYNAGEGRLQSAFRRAKSREVSAARRRPHGLANVTYDYVSKLQALSCLVAEPGRHGLNLPTGARFVPVVPVLADASIHSLDEIARRQGVSPAELRSLNPGFKSGKIVTGVPRLVLTPTLGRQATARTADAVAVVEPVADAQASASAGGFHEVVAGDSLWKIARKHGLTIDQLLSFNRGLSIGARVRPGQRIKLGP